MAPEFDMKKVTTPLLIHMLGQELRFPRLFLLRCKLTLGGFKKTIDGRFPRELIDLAALPAWVYLNLRKKVELTSAFIYLRDAGYEVIAFEGPGQGVALIVNWLDVVPSRTATS